LTNKRGAWNNVRQNWIECDQMDMSVYFERKEVKCKTQRIIEIGTSQFGDWEG